MPPHREQKPRTGQRSRQRRALGWTQEKASTRSRDEAHRPRNHDCFAFAVITARAAVPGAAIWNDSSIVSDEDGVGGFAGGDGTDAHGVRFLAGAHDAVGQNAGIDWAGYGNPRCNCNPIHLRESFSSPHRPITILRTCWPAGSPVAAHDAIASLGEVHRRLDSGPWVAWR